MHARHFSTALHATVAALVLLTIAAPARADDPVNPDAKCSESLAAAIDFNPSYVTCTQNYLGQPAPQTTIAPFAGYGSFEFVGQSTNDNSGSGPFEPFTTGFSGGLLTLDVAQDKAFVIALASRAADPSKTNYALYLYQPGNLGVGFTVSSIAFTTLGVTNVLGGPFQLEYANLYTSVIPEPSSYALMLAGMLSVSALALRRRRRA